MSEPFSFLPVLFILWALRALAQRQSDSSAIPLDVNSPPVRRASDIEDLIEKGALENALARGRAWLREIDTYREPCESVAAGCLASILEAQIRRLPDGLEAASNFGEELLATLNARPSGGTTAKLRTLGALGTIAESAGDHAMARTRFEAAVELAESADHVAPIDRAYFLYRHALSSRACGDLDEAARQLERALALVNDDSEHGEQRLRTLMLTGIVLFEKQRIQESRAAFERALALVGASPDLEEGFWVGAGMFWGQVLLAQNDAGAAEALARAAEVEERVLGPKSSAPIPTLYHLAEAHIARGSLPDAVAALERARAIHDRAIGRHSVGLREIMTSLSRVKFEQGQREEARRLLTELVEAEEHADPPNASVVATVLVNLAAVCRAMGDIRGERERLERALATAERANGVESATLIPILERLGLALWNSSDWADARDVNGRLAAIQREQLGPDHPNLASTLLNQAVVTARCADHEAAQRLLTETVSIFEATPFRPPESVENLVTQLEALHRHPVHGGGYRSLLSRARVLRSEGIGGLPMAQA